MTKPEDTVISNAKWVGRFPRNEIISLIDENRRHNLGESTARDLSFGDLLDLLEDDREALRSLSLGYGSSTGSPVLRQVVADACGIPSDWVITTQGCALGMFLLAFELCRPGDEAVLVTPCFPHSRDGLNSCGVRIRQVPVRFSDGYRIDPSRIADALSPATRLVSIATPQNPSGVRVPEATIRAILDAMTARAPDAWLFVDETYRDATYGNEMPLPSAAATGRRVITGSSVSKAHGAPGLRVGWLTVADDDLRQRLAVAKFNTVISGSVVGEALAAALLARASSVLAPRRALLAAGLASLAQWHARERHRLEWIRPDAGALCCFRLAPGAFDAIAVERFWAALPGNELQLASGTWFGDEPGVFRLGFGYLPVADLPAALAAVSRAMDQAVA